MSAAINFYFCCYRKATCVKMNRLAYLFFMFFTTLLFILFVYNTANFVSPNISTLQYKDVSHLKQGNWMPILPDVKYRDRVIKLHHERPLQTIKSKENSEIKLQNVIQSSSDQNGDSLEATNSTNKKPLLIVILARMRTGSTFCGEIFNQNPDMFFLFEPLHALDKYIRTNRLNNENWRFQPTHLLKSLSECVFPDNYIIDLARWGLGRVKSSGVTPLCRKTNGCKTVNPQSISKRCNRYDSMVFKLIRGDLNIVEALVTRYGIDVKIIHLMRDPRGTASSRKSYYNKKDMSLPLNHLYLLEEHPPKRVNTIPTLCKWMKETVRAAVKRPAWMQGHYKMVRFEDMAISPMRLSQDIYDFIGVEMNPKVKAWIKENTQGDNEDSNKQFSTHKNSTAAATSWRQRLTLQEVLEVQSLCREVMGMLGYDLVQSEEDLIDASKAVFHPLDVGADISLT